MPILPELEEWRQENLAVYAKYSKFQDNLELFQTLSQDDKLPIFFTLINSHI